MKTIGVLSDTHGFIDNKIMDFFHDCNEIWHAGDIGSIDVADKLASFKSFRGVYGNMDGQDVRLTYTKISRFRCEEVDVLITHIGGYPGRYDKEIKGLLDADAPDLFIAGHSHILKVMYDKKYQFLYINPGAAGKSGFHKSRTAVRFQIDKHEIMNLEVIDIKK